MVCGITYIFQTYPGLDPGSMVAFIPNGCQLSLACDATQSFRETLSFTSSSSPFVFMFPLYPSSPEFAKRILRGSISPLSLSLDPPAKPEDDIRRKVAPAAFVSAQTKTSSRTHVRDLPHYLNTKIPPFALQMFGMTKSVIPSPEFAKPHPIPSSPGFAKQIIRGSIKQKDPSTALASLRMIARRGAVPPPTKFRGTK